MTRAAKRARHAPSEPVAPTMPKPAYRSIADVPPGKCWICAADHHEALGTGAAKNTDLAEPDVANAMHHVLIAAFGPISDRAEVHSPEWVQAYTTLATHMGHFGSAVAHFARVKEFHRTAALATEIATKEAIGVFFEQLIERQGEGTYQFEVRRNPAYTPSGRRVN